MQHSNELSKNQEKTLSQGSRQKKSNEKDELKRRRLDDKEQRRLAREEEKRRKLAEREQKRLAREEEKRRKLAEREQKRLAREEEKRPKSAEKELKRLAREEEKRKKITERNEKKIAEDNEIKRKVAEISGRKLIESEGISYLSLDDGYPSFIGVNCPKCGSTNFKIEKTEELCDKGIIVNYALGAVGKNVASTASETNYDVKEISLKCNDCRKIFYSLPNNAPDEDILDEPCTVTVKRISRIIGAAVIHQIFLNGLKIGTVKNDEEITFNTYTKTNVLFISDYHGVRVGQFEFTAENGGSKRIEYKRKN